MTIQRHIQLFSVALLVLLISWNSTLSHMVGILWSIDVFSHGLMVPFVTAALIWSRRAILAQIKPLFSLVGSGFVLVACVLWLAGELLDIALFSHTALMLAINGLVLSFFGLQFYRAILFPMLFLFMAVPFGYELVGPLQTMTANLVVGVLDLVGADYEADGVLIKLPSGLYEVAEACAGVKFLFTSIVTGVLLAHLVFNSWRRRVLILIISAVLPIAANALRVLGILAIAEITDASFAKDVDHIVYGWVFLSIVLFSLIIFAYKISDKSVTEDRKTNDQVYSHADSGSSKVIAGIIALLLPISATFMAPPNSQRDYTENNVQIGPLFDAVPSGYRILEDSSTISNPTFVGADDVRVSMLRRDGRVFLVTHAQFNQLSQAVRLFQPGNKLAGPNWAEMRGLDSKSSAACETANNERILRNQGRRMLAWGFYFVNGQPVVSGLNEKFLTGMARLRRDQAAGEIFVISAPIDDDIENVRGLFADFLSTFSSDGLLWASGGGKVRDSIICAG